VRAGRACAAAALAAFAWAASCTFKPDLSRYEPCGPGDSCSAGYQCLGSAQICIPACEDPPLCGAEPDAGPPELSVSPEVLPFAIEARSYRVDLVADGGVGPYWFRGMPPLPPGLQLDDAGVLSGTPAEAGLYQVSVQVEDRSSPPVSSTAERDLPVKALLRLAGPAMLANAAAGQTYTEWLSATGGDGGYRFHLTDAGGLPQGLVLGEDGQITGSTPNSGDTLFDVEVVDGDSPAQVAVRRVSLSVIFLPLAPQIATRSLPDGRLRTPYSYRLQRLAGGSSPMWTLFAGDLPGGLTLNTSSGLISGTPTGRGGSSFTIELKDGIATERVTFTIDVL